MESEPRLMHLEPNHPNKNKYVKHLDLVHDVSISSRREANLTMIDSNSGRRMSRLYQIPRFGEKSSQKKEGKCIVSPGDKRKKLIGYLKKGEKVGVLG